MTTRTSKPIEQWRRELHMLDVPAAALLTVLDRFGIEEPLRTQVIRDVPYETIKAIAGYVRRLVLDPAKDIRSPTGLFVSLLRKELEKRELP